MIDMLKDLAVLSPVIGVLIVVIIYLYRENTKKDTKLEGLNKEIRESEKSTLELLNSLTNTLEHLSKSSDGNSDNIDKLTSEIRDFKNDLEMRLMEINTKLSYE